MAAFVLLTLAVSASGCLPALATVYPAVRPVSALIDLIEGAVLVPFFCLFPDGQFVPRWTRWVALAWIAESVLTAVLPALHPLDRLALPVAFAFIVGLQLYRYRCRYGSVQRQQTKWVFLGMALQALVLLTLVVLSRSVPALLQPHSAAYAVAGEAWLCAKFFGPLGIAFAILRYRLWEVDHVLNCALVYGGEPIGQLVLAPRSPAEQFSSADRRLLADLARQAGVVAHGVLLATDLERSRVRIVSAREEARRRLGNDLHDGLGHRLTGLLRQVETASHVLDRDPAAAKLALHNLACEMRVTIENVR